ncbi:MAG TPA: TIGR00730 family Rossman fold protein [Nitrospiria bacterium]|nr:TIGR00730 family Rossman fold protein [Nitrospiria bacterium]
MGKRYSLEQGSFDDHIINLVQMCGGSPHADLIKEIIVTALKLVEDPAARVDVKILNAALRELRFAFKLFSGYRHIRKVTVFGSARTAETDPSYKQAATFAHKIVRHGYMVITGAGDGIMKGAQEGAGRKMSFGVNIQLPFEQQPNVYIENDPKLVTFKYFFTRKLIFVKETDAIALFPGGFGTLDEMFESLTLVQTGKTDIMPIVLIDAPGGSYWSEWQRNLEKNLLKRGLIAAEDMHFFKITDNVDAAVKEVTGFYHNYHSSRYLGENLIVRLQRPVSDALLHKLNDSFKDILIQGRIERCAAAPEESDELDLNRLPRLTLHFNRKNFGRLRQLIDMLNTE